MRPGWVVVVLVASFALVGCSYQPEARTSGWRTVETEHIRLRTRLDAGRAVRLARELQQVRDVLAGTVVRCPVVRPDDKFIVTAMPADEFEEIAPTGFAAFMRGVPISWLPEYEAQVVMPDDFGTEVGQIFQHELTHHLLLMCLPRAPVWLHEGMAATLETAIVDGDVVKIGIPPFALTRDRRPPEIRHYRGILVVAMSRDHLPPVRDVVAMRNIRVGEHEAHDWLRTAARYATSWALVHLLLIGDAELQPRFTAYLTALDRGDEDPEALFEKHFAGVSVQRRLDRYVLDGQFRYVTRPIRLAPRGAPRQIALSAGEANLQWAWLWSGASGVEEARDRYRLHLDAAMADPTVASRAHVLAAMDRVLRRRDAVGAEREIDAGLRAAPDDPALLHAKVDLVLHRKGDVAGAAERLRKVAGTADQMCAVAEVDLAAGRIKPAVALVVAGLKRKPSSMRCREGADAIRKLKSPPPSS